MRFYGGLLKVLSILLMLANTVGWTIAAVVEIEEYGMSEYVWVFVLLWLGIMLILLAMFGTGMALSQIAKLKKRVVQLEKQGLTVHTYAAPMPAEVPRQPEVIPQQPQMPPVMPAEEPNMAEPSLPAEPAPKKAKNKKLLLLVLVVVAVIAVVVLVLSLVGGKNDVEDPSMSPAVIQPAEDMEQPGQYQEPAVEEAPQDDAIPVYLGGSIDNENFTMTFDSMEMYDEYSFRTSEYSTTSLFVEEGYKVLVVQGHFTNNSTGVISDSAFHLRATVNDVYTAEGYNVRISFVRNKSFEVDPFTDVDYVLYVNVPEKIAAEFETATFHIGWLNDMSYPTTVYNIDGTQTVELDQQYAFTAGTGATEAAEAEEVEYNWISIGQTVNTGDYEFTLLNVEMSYEVLPSNTSSVYSSYPADSGKVFVHVEADVKNLMQRDIRIDELFTAGAYYDWKYPYDGFTIVDDGNRFDWVGNYVAATPLETCRAHSLIECPVEVDTSGNSVIVNIQLGDEIYYYTLR